MEILCTRKGRFFITFWELLTFSLCSPPPPLSFSLHHLSFSCLSLAFHHPFISTYCTVKRKGAINLCSSARPSEKWPPSASVNSAPALGINSGSCPASALWHQLLCLPVVRQHMWHNQYYSACVCSYSKHSICTHEQHFMILYSSSFYQGCLHASATLIKSLWSTSILSCSSYVDVYKLQIW